MTGNIKLLMTNNQIRQLKELNLSNYIIIYLFRLQ